MDLSKLNLVWDSALNFIEQRIADYNVFATFFKDTKLLAVEGDNAYIEVSSKFAKELIQSRYLDYITSALEEVTKKNYKGILKIKNEERDFTFSKDSNKSVFVSNINKGYTFDNFVVGPSNQEAHSASLTAALEPGQFYNPLFIYGKSGIGKTHLLHAIGNYVLVKNNKKDMNVYYTSSTDFLDDYMHSVRMGTIEDFKEKFKIVDVLLIDDIQFLSKKEKTSEMFFNIFNHLINNHKQIVITSDRSPNELRGLEERLVSRFTSGLSVIIQNPEYETSLLILKKKVELLDNLNKKIEDDVLSYVALKYSKDIRQLEGALNRLVFYADSFKKQTKVIDLELAKEALKGLVVNSNLESSTSLNPDKIKMSVADYYKLSVSQMVSSSRLSNITNARHIAMYLIRTLLDLPFVKIGEEFGGRDHSTVINACDKVERMLKTDTNFKQAVDDIKMMLK
ncbi:TPA: chromosomal replication initiator protein DnaA [bacterium]|nr:chromosomal replication initiator protein DnaA [bacterium]